MAKKQQPNPDNLEAQRLVNQLKAQGMSNAEIARQISVGRAKPLNDSYVSQISRKGNKGAAFVPALKQLQVGQAAPATPQRTTKTGTTANVRQPKKAPAPKPEPKRPQPTDLPGGRYVPAYGRTAKSIGRELRAAAAANRQVKLAIKVSRARFYGKDWEKNPQPINLYQKGGYSAKKLVSRIDNLIAGGKTENQAINEVLKGDLLETGFLDGVGAIETIQIRAADKFIK